METEKDKKLPAENKRNHREEYLQGVSQRELNRKYGVSRYTAVIMLGQKNR